MKITNKSSRTGTLSMKSVASGRHWLHADEGPGQAWEPVLAFARNGCKIRNYPGPSVP